MIILQGRIKAARELRGLTQAQLASRAGLPAASISHFEGGRRRPSLDNFRRLATALGVSADYLLGFTDSTTTEGESGQLSMIMGTLSARDRDMVIKFAATLPQVTY